MSSGFDRIIQISHLPYLGWMPIIVDGEGKELYRGEYRLEPWDALDHAVQCLIKDNPDPKALKKLGVAP